MSTTKLLVLGAIAGGTIFLGLPLGRIRRPSSAVRALLNALAIGILVFLLWDVLSHAIEPVEAALTAASVDHTGGWGRFAGYAAVLAGGLALGLLPLVYWDRWQRRRVRPEGPGAQTATAVRAPAGVVADDGRRLALLIAMGIGFHNFSEGLSIGQSAARGEIGLAVLLVIGFGLHNATEGFGIVAPFTGGEHRPSWALLTGLGLVGGGPTFVGTLVGHSFVNEVVFVAFLAVAAGSILFVVVELLGVARKLGHRELLAWGLLLGFLVGLATDFVVTAAGV